jgi:hypothetical protein
MTRGPDLTGQKRSMLLVIERAGKMANGGQAWRCRCDCGKDCVVSTSNLNKRGTVSCGCYRRRSLGHSSHANEAPEFATWGAMLDRCRNPNNKNYIRYGGRGISVCERWETYVNFFADVGPRPSAGHSLDRIDVDGNYEPGNVRWATASQQQRNKRNSVMVPYQGKMMHVYDVAEIVGLHPAMITSRYQRGWPVEELYLPRQRAKSHRPGLEET